MRGLWQKLKIDPVSVALKLWQHSQANREHAAAALQGRAT
jgi:hypothetical protein